MFFRDRFRAPFSIAFAFVATHNHFVIDRGGKVFNRSAPVIKLSGAAMEDDHLTLLGLLNSSTACFWMKQVFHNKGSTVDTRGARQTLMPSRTFMSSPAPDSRSSPSPKIQHRRLRYGARSLGRERMLICLGSSVCALAACLALKWTPNVPRRRSLLRRMIALQEELDWRCYTLYGITDQDLCHSDTSRNRARSTCVRDRYGPPNGQG